MKKTKFRIFMSVLLCLLMASSPLTAFTAAGDELADPGEIVVADVNDEAEELAAADEAVEDVDVAAAFAVVADAEEEEEAYAEELPAPVELEPASVVIGNLGEVRLITGAELEIEFSAPVLNDVDAHDTFTILVDGVAAEWEFLSYFAFGPYASAPVVNARLKNPLDAGEPRGRRRTSAAEAHLDRTEHILGPIAAARITVVAGAAEKTAEWEPFYMERSQGNMSRYFTYASQKAGNNGTVLKLTNSLTDFQTSRNVFSATTQPLYTDEYVVRMVAEGMNKVTGRMEYLNLPLLYAGFKALIVGPSQSVYEVPEYRELYVHGVTTDTYTRQNIKATEVPGNYDPATGKFKKAYIVGTADDVFQHYSPMKADGTPSTGDADAARPKIDHFYFGEAFFDIFYELGVLQGSQGFPLTAFNNWDDYRFDVHLQEAYDKAKAAGMWPNTKMMESVKDYYVGGALIHFEMNHETQNFEYTTGPINSRYELYDYDYPLFWALSGLHSQIQFWCGLESVSANSDSWKYHTPWFWQNQVDNYGPPATPNGTAGVPYPPLAIESVDVVANNQIHVTFNREIRTLQAATTAANWRIYIDDREVTPGIFGGYGWRAIRLTTNNSVNFQTGLSTANDNNRLDNGKPYGRYFCGFTQKDIDERCVAAGGWIANNQAPGVNALDFGEFVSVTDAIEKYGAGLSGKIEVAYVGGASAAPAVLDWDGNEIVKNVKYEAGFMPWIGHVYRTPLTGFYVYLDSAVGSRDYYMYRKILDPSSDRYDPDFVMPTAREVAMTAGHQYECEFTVNTTVTYPTNSGGADFDYAFGDNSSADWSLTNPGWTLDYTWTPGVVTRGAQTITQGPVTVDRPGQMTIDGFVRQSGGLLLGALSVRGNHPHKQPQSSGLGAGIGDTLRIEGNGGITFQSVDVAVLRDYNLALYRNESLILHEGGHGIDSAQGIYAQNLYNDMTSAFATATAPKNGMRWFTVDGVPCYVGSRGEYVSSGSTFWAGVMRESFEGVNDTVWTPNCNREELLRYDPYSFEALKRIKFNGDLGLWYEGRIGDPDYRVLPEDWELLRDQDPQFSHWTGENNLVAWGLSIKSIANYNPYTGQSNPLIRWISFNNPSLWDVEPYRAPTRDGWRSNIRYDFVGRNPYHPPEGDGPPTQSQTHPFFAGEGVKRPVRPYESLLLSKPVTGEISNIHIPYSPVLVEFELANYSGEVTMDNAPNSFELFVNGKLTHFYFWTFEEIAPGVAKVALRLEWPLDPDDFDKVTITLRPVPLEKVTPTAFVTKLNGNKNDLTISVVELYANGMTKETTKTYSIDNNAAGTYAVGDHKVYVATSGNTNITAISVVSSDPKGPFYVPPAERVLVNAVTSAKDIISSTGTAVTFKVTESYSDGSAEVVQKTVQIAKNSSGKIDLGAYYLVYDIAGNGSNVKTFNISMK